MTRHREAEINRRRQSQIRRAQLRPVLSVESRVTGEIISDTPQPQPRVRIVHRERAGQCRHAVAGASRLEIATADARRRHHARCTRAGRERFARDHARFRPRIRQRERIESHLHVEVAGALHVTKLKLVRRPADVCAAARDVQTVANRHLRARERRRTHRLARVEARVKLHLRIIRHGIRGDRLIGDVVHRERIKRGVSHGADGEHYIALRSIQCAIENRDTTVQQIIRCARCTRRGDALRESHQHLVQADRLCAE